MTSLVKILKDDLDDVNSKGGTVAGLVVGLILVLSSIIVVFCYIYKQRSASIEEYDEGGE